MSCAWKTFIIGTIVCQNLCGRHIEPTNKPAIFIHFLVVAFAAYQWNCSYMISGAILNLILLLLIAISRLLVSVSIQLLVWRRYHLDLRKSFPWYHNSTRQSKAIVCSELFPKGDQTFREKRKGFGSSLAFLLRNKAFHCLCRNWDILRIHWSFWSYLTPEDYYEVILFSPTSVIILHSKADPYPLKGLTADLFERIFLWKEKNSKSLTSFHIYSPFNITHSGKIQGVNIFPIHSVIQFITFSFRNAQKAPFNRPLSNHFFPIFTKNR